MSSKKYLLIHRHEYGMSHALFTAEGFNPTKLTEEDEYVALAKACELNFEPHKGEDVTVVDFEDCTYHISKKDISK